MAARESVHSKTQLDMFLEDLGLEQHYKNKLSLSKLLQIDKKTITDEPKCNSDLPWYFLKKLMMVNVTARNVECTSACESDCSDAAGDTGDMVNPLDIITALFLCSDGFVQQEMALKMSMCQFSVPLLLPNCDTKQCTLMLWAMRDIVKKYRPQSLSESKGFIEQRIVLSELPMISFVRLGECSLSKSEILNKLLSNSQQYHDTFVHRNMECGDNPRRISNGLAEITWYLPCGNKKMDVFSEPVAVANLRGDIASFETQFSFLCQTSAAVFVFFDTLDSDCEVLTNQHHKAQIFLVGNHHSNPSGKDALEKVATKLGLTDSNILLKPKKMNDARFINNLKEKVSNVVENSKMNMRIEQMADIAHELGIWVDEDSSECQDAKKNADAITAEIHNILNYKEHQLPLQGQIWKELTRLEKEEFRLRKVGSQDIEKYKSDLQLQRTKLWEKQNSHGMSNAMTCFINAITSPGIERCYFLKWMRFNLDDVSRKKLSGLREQNKEKCKNSENKEEIKDIDRQLSNSSLGTEHFFREMGQIYEASLSLPETDLSRQQLQHLPKLCAELLLDGFPLELVDGDASNIPLRWVSDVLSQLNDLVSPKSKILVVTVLGVQSTGKSTLLNTMFGVQFAVSSGRCTRGAFMLLIRIDEDAKKELNCDFMVIIDTEGLKSPELAQLDNSHEHDNELATLVVGLSDISIINIAMENSTEMKDILQIAVHAFLRMKEVGKKKPKCQFVHQNVSDVSAHEKNSGDRKLLLEQLNEMTQAAAKMERKEENKSFTDVMEYSPDTGNWYIPGLWNGNPPMAPVNAGYSEAVYELKKNIIQILGSCAFSANNISEFTEWMKSLWTAVKHENFIFSFRNSLVADAYMRLCTEFNKWEWEFKKQMYAWVTKAETRISNFGTMAVKSDVSDISEVLTDLKGEASTELSKWETKILDNLTQYFKQTEGHVYLVEAYRGEFANSAKSLRKEMQSSVFNQLTAAADIRRGMAELDKIKENHTKELEQRMSQLSDNCLKKKPSLTDEELHKEFDKMWKEMMTDLCLSKQEPKNIITNVDLYLKENVKRKGSNVCPVLSQRSLKDCGLEPFTYSVKGFYEQFKHKLSRLFNNANHVMALQKLSDSIMMTCKQSVTEKKERKTDYHDTYIQEILDTIDEKLRNHQEVKTEIEFEVSLKQHICGFAAREFQKMHEEFIHANDPYRWLNKNKEKSLAIFKVFHTEELCKEKSRQEEARKEELRLEELRKEELRKEELRKEELRLEELRKEALRQEEEEKKKLLHEELRKEKLRLEELRKEALRQQALIEEALQKDKLRKEALRKEEMVRQCTKKAEEFIERCLRPAVEEFVNRSLGPDIIGEMLKSEQFRPRMSLQYSILLDLLSKDEVENYLSYILSYEEYVKKWILDQIVEHFSNQSKMAELENKHINSSITSINNAINKAKGKSGDLKTFVEVVCQELGDKLVISQDAINNFMMLNNADKEQFAHWLTECVKDMAQGLREKFKKTNIQMKLKSLHVKPHNKLFSDLIGCGKQCPFCKAPCDAGVTAHTEHWTSLHRPQGLALWTWDSSKALVTDICSSSVISGCRFRCNATNNKCHPYKQYREIFPDWKISPDGSPQASDYWKYVMKKFNTNIAKSYNVKPADIPATWYAIEKKQAEASLKESFNIK